MGGDEAGKVRVEMGKSVARIKAIFDEAQQMFDKANKDGPQGGGQGT